MDSEGRRQEAAVERVEIVIAWIGGSEGFVDASMDPRGVGAPCGCGERGAGGLGVRGFHNYLPFC